MTAADGVCTFIVKTALGRCSVDGGFSFNLSLMVKGRCASSRSSLGKRSKLRCVKVEILSLKLKLGYAMLLGLYKNIPTFSVQPSFV